MNPTPIKSVVSLDSESKSKLKEFEDATACLE
jgi:hypothetical protein